MDVVILNKEKILQFSEHEKNPETIELQIFLKVPTDGFFGKLTEGKLHLFCNKKTINLLELERLSEQRFRSAIPVREIWWLNQK